MEIFRWQWRLANRGLVTAVIDTTKNVETVSQSSRLLSEAPRGSRVEGHTVIVEGEGVAGASERPPIEAVLTFDPRLPICVLRVDGHEVAPTAWPVREKTVETPTSRSFPMKAVVFAAAGVLVSAGILLVATRRREVVPTRPDAQLSATHRSLNGLFVAHFPTELEPRLAILPTGVGGILLEDKSKTVTIVLAGTPADPSMTNDPWAIQQRLRDEALANVPKGAARFEETSRREETCLGERGAVVVGLLSHKNTPRARIWSCAFVHAGTSYFALYSLAEPTSPTDQKRVRAIIDATELTQLADLGAPPDPPPTLDPR